jgi:hypothetical protein
MNIIAAKIQFCSHANQFMIGIKSRQMNGRHSLGPAGGQVKEVVGDGQAFVGGEGEVVGWGVLVGARPQVRFMLEYPACFSSRRKFGLIIVRKAHPPRYFG